MKRTHAVSRRELDSARAPEFGLHELKHIVDTLRAALRWGVRVGLIGRNPAEGVAPVKVPRREMRALDAAGAAALVEAARGSDLEHLVVVAVGTGLRRGELLGLRWPDVDLSRSASSCGVASRSSKESG